MKSDVPAGSSECGGYRMELEQAFQQIFAERISRNSSLVRNPDWFPDQTLSISYNVCRPCMTKN